MFQQDDDHKYKLVVLRVCGKYVKAKEGETGTDVEFTGEVKRLLLEVDVLGLALCRERDELVPPCRAVL